jgi:hypothetical protein
MKYERQHDKSYDIIYIFVYFYYVIINEHVQY